MEQRFPIDNLTIGDHIVCRICLQDLASASYLLDETSSSTGITFRSLVSMCSSVEVRCVYISISFYPNGKPQLIKLLYLVNVNSWMRMPNFRVACAWNALENCTWSTSSGAKWNWPKNTCCRNVTKSNLELIRIGTWTLAWSCWVPTRFWTKTVCRNSLTSHRCHLYAGISKNKAILSLIIQFMLDFQLLPIAELRWLMINRQRTTNPNKQESKCAIILIYQPSKQRVVVNQPFVNVIVFAEPHKDPRAPDLHWIPAPRVSRLPQGVSQSSTAHQAPGQQASGAQQSERRQATSVSTRTLRQGVHYAGQSERPFGGAYG